MKLAEVCVKDICYHQYSSPHAEMMMMMIKTMDLVEEGVKIEGELLKDVRFADDQAIIVYQVQREDCNG